MAAREDEERKYSAPALEKGLDVLELLAARGAPLTMSQIAAELGRSVSELFRMVDALVHRGYVAPAESGDGFELTNKLFALGIARAPAKSLLEHALPEMRKLTQAIRQSCHLAVASEERHRHRPHRGAGPPGASRNRNSLNFRRFGVSTATTSLGSLEVKSHRSWYRIGTTSPCANSED